MNKDFLTKPISFKDIDLKKLNLKNNKQIVIGILILVYIIVIVCIGNVLISNRAEVKAEHETKETKYNSLKAASSEDEIREKIKELEAEAETLSNEMVEINSSAERTKIFKDFRSGSPIKWEEDSEKITQKSETKEMAGYEIYTVNVGNFSGTYSQIEDFLKYVENYEKVVRIDTLAFKSNSVTGKLSGQLRLSFYFKGTSEV